MPDRRRLRDRKREVLRKRRRKRRMRRFLFLMAELLILGILAGTAYVMAKYDKFQTVSFEDGEIKMNSEAKKEGYMTIALFGGDSREGALEEGAHADTIMIAAINNKTKEVRMVSVYRDTLTEQMDGSVKKANNAYFVGGPKEAINMLNKNYDLDITDYVTVDFKALSDAIDLLGGIEVEVSDAEVQQINKYVNETAKVAGKKANKLSKAGTYTLDGPQAVTYARIRKNVGGDYKRTERQRLVIEKAANKAKKSDLATINKILDTVFPQISTSFSLKDLIGLASGAFDYTIGETTGYPMEVVDGRVDGLGSVVIPVGITENVEELHEFLYPQEKAKEVSDTVKGIADKVENLTGITRNELENKSADIVRSSYSQKKLQKEEKAETTNPSEQ